MVQRNHYLSNQHQKQIPKLRLIPINYLDHTGIILICTDALDTILLNEECVSASYPKTKRLSDNTLAKSWNLSP